MNKPECTFDDWVPRTLHSLSPGAIVALCRRLEGDDREYDTVRDAIDFLPEVNLPLARAVHITFSESPLARDRVYAAGSLPGITRKDHDFGLELWHRYARDREEVVRTAATEYIIEAQRDDPRPHESKPISSYGITWGESDWLLDVANRTARGELPYYDLGGIAVARLLGEPDELTGITPTTFDDSPLRRA